MASISQLTARLVDLFGTPSTANPAKLLNNLQVSPNGNVLVGTGTDDGVEKLQVTGATKVTGALTVTSNVTSNANVQATGGYLISGATGSGTAACDYRYDGFMSQWNGSTQAWGTYYGVARGDAAYYFHFSGQAGTPAWVWGGSDGVNMYVYNPANFSVNYANTAGSVGGVSNPIAITGGTFSGYVGFSSTVAINGTVSLNAAQGFTGNYGTMTNLHAIGSSGSYAGTAQGTWIGWNDSNGGGEGMLCCNQGGGSGGWVIRTVNVSNSAEIGRFTISGSGVGTNGSDIRLKDNVETLNDSLSKIRQVRPVSYTYKASGEKHLGVIAQEIQPIFPDVVTVTHNDEQYEDLLGVSYTDLIAPLIQSVQQLADKLDEANRRIASLEEQLKEKQQ